MIIKYFYANFQLQFFNNKIERKPKGRFGPIEKGKTKNCGRFDGFPIDGSNGKIYENKNGMDGPGLANIFTGKFIKIIYLKFTNTN